MPVEKETEERRDARVQGRREEGMEGRHRGRRLEGTRHAAGGAALGPRTAHRC